MSDSKEIVKSDRYNADFEYLKILVDSKQIPCTSVEQAFTIAEYGKQLGFAPIVAFSFIFNQKGKLSISASGIRAILIREGIAWETIYDGSYMYNDGVVREVGSITQNERGQAVKAVDRITKIKFTRVIKTNTGSKTIIEIGTFLLSTAQNAGLYKPDSAWSKYPANMLYARAFTNGANRIASDVLMGLYSTDVISDEVGIEDESLVTREENGSILNIKTKEQVQAEKIREQEAQEVTFTEISVEEVKNN